MYKVGDILWINKNNPYMSKLKLGDIVRVIEVNSDNYVVNSIDRGTWYIKDDSVFPAPENQNSPMLRLVKVYNESR